jgi:hypothetical protein
MDEVLRLRVDHQIDETATGFFSRLALVNGRNPYRFGEDMRVPFQSVISGQQEAVYRLAALGGVDPEILARNAFTSMPGRTAQIRGLVFRRQGLVRSWLRFCPHCIAGDLEAPLPNAWMPVHMHAHQRLAWSLTNIRCCTIHSVRLVEEGLGGLGPDKAYDFSTRIEAHTANLPRLLAEAEPMKPTPCDTLITQHLMGSGPSEGFIGSLDLIVAVQSAERLGLLSVFGPKAMISQASPQDLQTCAAVGHSILAEGPPAIKALFAEVAATRQRTEGVHAAVKQLYGSIYSWLSDEATDPQYDALRDVLREHLIETVPFAAGDIVLGKRVEARTLHSIRTLYRESGHHPKRTRKLLQAAGLIDENNTAQYDDVIVFDAKIAEILLTASRDDLSENELGQYIGSQRVETRTIIKEGFVKPYLSRPQTENQNPRHGFRERFTKAEADRFLAAISAHSVSIDTPPPNSAHLSEASRRAIWPLKHIIEAAISGDLNWVGRLTSAHGFTSILVDVPEIKKRALGPALQGLTKQQVAARLQITSVAVPQLIAKGLLRTAPERHPALHCMMETVQVGSIDTFSERYATLGELCRHHRLPALATLKLLASRNCSPVMTKAEVGVYLFLRSELPL